MMGTFFLSLVPYKGLALFYCEGIMYSAMRPSGMFIINQLIPGGYADNNFYLFSSSSLLINTSSLIVDVSLFFQLVCRDVKAGSGNWFQFPSDSVLVLMVKCEMKLREGVMAVKIFIKRKVTEDNVLELTTLLKKLRSLTLSQPGYISGETLRRLDAPEECMVISTWSTREAWEAWLANERRQTIQSEIDELLGSKTEYAVYGE